MRLPRGESQDRVAKALARAAQGAQLVEDEGLKRASLGPGAAALALRCRMAGYYSPFDHLGHQAERLLSQRLSPVRQRNQR
jgi:hypothetical protein